MIYFLVFYGLMVAISSGSYIVDMSNANGAPQQCVAAASAIFTLLVPYTMLKAYYCWRSFEQNRELIQLLKSERQ